LKQLQVIHINYEFDEKYEDNPEFNEALIRFMECWGWKPAGSGLNLIKQERDLFFKKDKD